MKKGVSLLLLIATVLATNAQELKPEYAAEYMLDEITSQPIEGVLAIVNNRDVVRRALAFNTYNVTV